MTTTRLRAGAGTIDITHRNVTYSVDAQGIFTVPSDIASELINLRVAVLAPDAEPPSSPAPSNAFSVGAETVTLDLDSVDIRAKLLELESFARMNPKSYAHFANSAGSTFTFAANEISHLVHAVRARQFLQA